jgi:heme oxygenase
MERLSRTLIQLNIATRDHHAVADAPWLDLLAPTVNRDDYVRLLIKVYGFEAALEAACHYTPGLTTLVDLRARTRAGLLVQDLMRLGLSAARIAVLPQRFMAFSSAAEALGWMYVAERSTLLHGTVRRFLAQHISDVPGASSYLSAGGGVAAERWSALGNALDAASQMPWGKRQVLHAAHQGFLAQREWFLDAAALQSVGT